MGRRRKRTRAAGRKKTRRVIGVVEDEKDLVALVAQVGALCGIEKISTAAVRRGAVGLVSEREEEPASICSHPNLLYFLSIFIY